MEQKRCMSDAELYAEIQRVLANGERALKESRELLEQRQKSVARINTAERQNEQREGGEL